MLVTVVSAVRNGIELYPLLQDFSFHTGKLGCIVEVTLDCIGPEKTSCVCIVLLTTLRYCFFTRSGLELSSPRLGTEKPANLLK